MSAYLRCASCCVLALLLTPEVFANASPDPDPGLETVIVTAQMRAQNAIDVPFALTAYSGTFMKDVGIRDMDTLSLFVPGFEVRSRSLTNPGYAIRGITLDIGDPTQESRIAVFEDGVSISGTHAASIEMFDISRTEIAKGPQTTLFGRGALIGGVNIIQNKPVIGELSAKFDVGGGNYAYRMVGGVLNIPLSDDVSLRIAGRYKLRNGYIKNLNNGEDFNSVDTGAVRMSVGWAPSDNFRLDIIANFETDSPSSPSYKSTIFAPTNPDTGEIIGNKKYYTGVSLTNSSPALENNKKYGIYRTIWDIKAITKSRLDHNFMLTTTTAYRRYDTEEIIDGDGTALPIEQIAETINSDQYSHEMRLNWDNGGRVSAFGGVSYFYNNTYRQLPTVFDEYGILALYLWGNTSAYKSSMSNLLQNSSVSDFNTAMEGYAASYISGLMYSGYYSAASAAGLSDSSAAAYATSVSDSYGSALSGLMNTAEWEKYSEVGKTKAVDIYGDVTVHLTDDLELDGGLRFTREDKQSGYASKIGARSMLGILLNGSVSSILSDPTELAKLLSSTEVDADNPDSLLDYGISVQPTKNNGNRVTRHYGDNSLTWRVALRYALSDNSNVYVTYGRGRRPKVINGASPKSPYADPTFSKAPAEIVDSFETGFKTSADGDRLHFDTAIYFYQYSNFQSNMMYTEGATETIITVNAGKSQAWGIENSLDWQVSEWARLFLTYTYNRARFMGDSLYQGNKMRLNPDHKLSAGVSLSDTYHKWLMTFTPTYTWQSKIFFTNDNDIASEQSNLTPDYAVDEFQGAYGVVNLRLNATAPDSPLSVSLFVDNLLSQHYIIDTGIASDAIGTPTFVSGPPRFFGFDITLSFE